ncbi:hypothetical protein A9Q84_07765 [Halobacteriovorax marinus]|uniref:PLD phosphodiesterase domain-containing protein n=1 Tax=Halobacteriovorax marinus TaxID=97084 RepID=A0A1Y5F5T0_9BACT|nr:hypothetical protein A9Q84_07765 [Halobacteriovorax marinus]
MKKTTTLLFILSLTSSCSYFSSVPHPGRTIASTSDETVLKDMYQDQRMIQVYEDQRTMLNKIMIPDNQGNRRKVRNHKNKIRKLTKEISTLKKSYNSKKHMVSEGSTLPMYSFVEAGNGSFHFKDAIAIKDLSKYMVTKTSKGKTYNVPFHAYKNFEIDLTHNDEQEYFQAQMNCEGPFKFKSVYLKKSLDAKESKYFNWYNDDKKKLQSIKVFLNSKSKKCSLTFSNPETKDQYAINFIPEKTKSLRNKFQVCSLPKYSGNEKLKSHFLTKDFKSMTCPQEIAGIRTLEDAIEGLKSKAKSLLGRDIPDAMIETQDPFYPLDFSEMPQLDRILISYLVFRYDFYGATLIRLLEHHAKKGVEIKIVVSSVISLDKDVKKLKQLNDLYPNVKVHFYKFDGRAIGINEMISKLHRTMHIKLLLTQSDSHPENNSVVLGGRNIHDGFIFKSKPDLSKYPDLVQYGDGKDEGFARWTDFEVEIKDPAFINTLAGHYYTLFDYDHKSYLARSYNLNLENKHEIDAEYFETANGPIVRHFMSFPYKDGHALEKYYVKLIDSATKEISISTPYFNLTDKLSKAMSRAIERGVKIDLITRLDLEGDTADIILSDVNKKSVNRFYKNIQVFEYTNPADILHSKLFLVDGKVVAMGSVNFNQRSFFHDIENALIVWDRDFNQKIKSIIADYKLLARPINEKQKTKFWKSVIIKIFQKEL